MSYDEMAKQFMEEIAPSIQKDLGDCTMVSEEVEYNLLFYIRTAILCSATSVDLEEDAKGVLKRAYELISKNNIAKCIIDFCRNKPDYRVIPYYAHNPFEGWSCLAVYINDSIQFSDVLADFGTLFKENNILSFHDIGIKKLSEGCIYYFPSLSVDEFYQGNILDE